MGKVDKMALDGISPYWLKVHRFDPAYYPDALGLRDHPVNNMVKIQWAAREKACSVDIPNEKEWRKPRRTEGYYMPIGPRKYMADLEDEPRWVWEKSWNPQNYVKKIRWP